MFRKHLFLEHLCTMVSLSSEKVSWATTLDSFKDCILACKIRNQRHTNLQEKKFHKQSVEILLKNGCSVRDMFCTIFNPSSMVKVFGKHVRNSSYLVLVFFKKIYIYIENLLNSYFYYNKTYIYLRLNFWTIKGPWLFLRLTFS